MNDLRIVNLSSYTSPEIVEKSNKQWVAYGSDNNFFEIYKQEQNSLKDLEKKWSDQTEELERIL